VALSPAEAAELLGLSRPFVVRLLDQGEIPSGHLHEVGTVASSFPMCWPSRLGASAGGLAGQRIAALVEEADLPLLTSADGSRLR